MFVPFLLACVQGIDSPVFDAEVEKAQVKDLTMGSYGIVGGRFVMEGTLVVDTTDGGRLREPVVFDGGYVGFGMTLGGTVGADVTLDLPLGGPVRGGELFETYAGTYEALCPGAGVQSVNLQNKKGVHFDSTQFSGLIAIEVAFLSVDMKVVPPPEDTGDTGGNSGTGGSDTADSSDPADTADTAVSE